MRDNLSEDSPQTSQAFVHLRMLIITRGTPIYQKLDRKAAYDCVCNLIKTCVVVSCVSAVYRRDLPGDFGAFVGSLRVLMR